MKSDKQPVLEDEEISSWGESIVEAPKEIEQKIEGNLDLARFTGNLVTIFFGEMGKVFMNFFQTFDKTKKNN
jgi:hypothetical protein